MTADKYYFPWAIIVLLITIPPIYAASTHTQLEGSGGIRLKGAPEGATENPNLTLQPEQDAEMVFRPVDGHIRLGTVTFTTTGDISVKGEKGSHGPAGLPGRKGPVGVPGAKGEQGQPGYCTVDSPLMVQFATSDAKCHSGNKGMVRLHHSGNSLDICNGQHWRPVFAAPFDAVPAVGSTNTNTVPTAWPTTVVNRRLPQSCLDARFGDNGKENDMYWINPTEGDDKQNAMQAYCDMSSSGGGWTLVAKVTDDFAWICPEKNGRPCTNSDVDPREANLFHKVHERDEILLDDGMGTETGVHLDVAVIRDLFMSGRQQIRFTFYANDDSWEATDDGYASFPKNKPNTLFTEDTWSSYSKANMDYSWNIIKQRRRSRQFTAGIICWGYNAKEAYRYFDEGLHMGSPAQGGKACHLAANDNEIMLKSHYANTNSRGEFVWSTTQYGFLDSESFQVENKKIAIWVR